MFEKKITSWDFTSMYHDSRDYSVYEVYVKEETVGADGRSDISIVSGEPGTSGQLMQVSIIDI